MNQKERAICAQVRELRTRIGWQQSDFAKALKISYNQLVGVENARSPLPYSTAWKIREVFGISLNWLAGDGYPLDAIDLDEWPPLASIPNERALYSAVRESLRNAGYKPNLEDGDNHTSPSPRQRRAFWINYLQGWMIEWLTKLPDDKLLEFGRHLFQEAESFIDALPKASHTQIAGRESALLWDSLRSELQKRFPDGKIENPALTNVIVSANTNEVKAQWPLLKARLQKATSEKGSKSRLAEFLDLPLSSVSLWLSNSKSAREPGAETALRMLYWVERRERK